MVGSVIFVIYNQIQYMTFLNKLVFVVLSILVSSNMLFAQQSDSKSAEGRVGVLEPIGIINVDGQGLNFGSIAVGQVASKVVIGPVSPLSIQVEEGDAKILINNPQSPAKFQITGEVGRVYNILLPTSITVSNGTDNLLIDHFSSSISGNTGIISTSTVFYVGGRLNVTTNNPMGAYSGNFSVEVSYE